MCSVSMVITDFQTRHPGIIPNAVPQMSWAPFQTVPISPVSRDEFDTLKREVEALRGLLAAAKKFDEETGQPDCEQAEKVALLKRVAELVGVDISDVLA